METIEQRPGIAKYKGGLKDNKPHGEGEILYTDGSSYKASNALILRVNSKMGAYVAKAQLHSQTETSMSEL